MVLGFTDKHSPKSLLSCRVPQKQFDHNIRVKVHVMHLEIDSQWRLTGFIKRSFSEAMQKRRFPYGRVSENDDPESEVPRHLHRERLVSVSQNSEQVFAVGLTLWWLNKQVKKDKEGEVCRVMMHTHLFHNNSGLWKRGIVNNRNLLLLHNEKQYICERTWYVLHTAMKYDTVCNTIVKAFTVTLNMNSKSDAYLSKHHFNKHQYYN